MNVLRQAMGHAMLGWIKPELDQLLQLVGARIASFAEHPADGSCLHACVGQLHQVQGALRMVELHAPAMVAEEMEQLVQALRDGQAGDVQEACATLLRGTVLLPDYLERLQSGHRDVPIVLLPLLDDLRAALGQASLGESVLFAPDLERPLPQEVPEIEPMPADDRDAGLAQAHAHLERELAAWPDGGAPADAAALAAALMPLLRLAEHTPARRMLWVALKVAQALREGALEPTPALRQGFAGVARAMRQVKRGVVPGAVLGQEPTRQLLHQVAQCPGGHRALEELRGAFDLQAAFPGQADLEHARGSISGRNRALLDTVGAAVKEELMQVKDALDLQLRIGQDIAGLAPRVAQLGSIAETLGMLGLESARDVVRQQRDGLAELVQGRRVPDEAALLDIAGALLYADASLDAQAIHLGAPAPGTRAGESRLAIEAVAGQALRNLAQAREQCEAFIQTGWDHAQLEELPRLLDEVAGALHMLDLAEPGELAQGLRRYVATELIGRGRVPGASQLDTLADAMTGLERYLEALGEHRPDRDELLDITRSSLEALGDWPLPSATPGAAAAEREASGSFAARDAGNRDADAEADLIEAAFGLPGARPAGPEAAFAAAGQAPLEHLPAAAAPGHAGGQALAGGFDPSGSEIDEEIRAVFLEEFDEAIANLRRMLPAWRSDPENLDRLRPIRRVFHTLKGSGRLVGAHRLGELAWKVEDLLNRVLDGMRPLTPAVVALLEQAIQALPGLNAALRGSAGPRADLDGIQALAERVAAGEEVFCSAPRDPPTGVALAATQAPAPDPDGTPASVDSVLREILEAEVGQHLPTVQAWLEAAQAAGTAMASDPLLRALHTIDSALAMADVPEIIEVTGRAERYVKGLLGNGARADAAGLAALADTVGAIGQAMAALQSEPSRIPLFSALRARLDSLGQAVPADSGAAQGSAAAGPGGAGAAPIQSDPRDEAGAGMLAAPDQAQALDFARVDRALVEVFVEEARDLLDHSDRLLAGLREAPDDRGLVIGLQRELHTIKGSARMAGIDAIGELGHALESLLEPVAGDGAEVDRGVIALLERGFDALHGMLARTAAHRLATPQPDLLAQFEAWVLATAGASASVPGQPGRPVDEAPAAPGAAQPVLHQHAGPADLSGPGAPLAGPPAPSASAGAGVGAQPLPPLSAPIDLPAGGQDEGSALGTGQEQVRVRADLLDRLVNQAGEVAIYRARLEQQMGALRVAMAELGRTHARLHDQLRRLDLETEARIVARRQPGQDTGDTVFDPLELDRFSTLQQLSGALAESAADIGDLQAVLEEVAGQSEGLLEQQSQVGSQLREGLLRARMVPFEGSVPRLRRVLRQAAADTGKQARLQLEGAHGELDRNMLERMTTALEHLLRNAVAHGLESPQARRDAGKPEEGLVRVVLRREGSELLLQVADDGAGIDHAAIRRRAEQRGMLQAGAAPGLSDLERMILEPGFTTWEDVSQVAGRGVGLEVVHNQVRQLGGSLEIASAPGQGATFTLRLPQTLAVTRAVFVRSGQAQYAVPVAAVSGIGRIGRAGFQDAGAVYAHAGEDYALYDLGTLLGQGPARADGQPALPLLLIRAGDLRAAVAVDQVLGSREIVLKPVGPQIASIPGVHGATITGEGSVVVILDAAALVRRHLAQPAPAGAEVATARPCARLVMVVDDSLTMRKVTGRVLERHNLEVIAACDGAQALERLQERIPDLMLLDIEMPRMDGYALAAAMKADPRLADVPIVMITSRSGEKHRLHALEIGVQRYLGKPYRELDLMRHVQELLGMARVRD